MNPDDAKKVAESMTRHLHKRIQLFRIARHEVLPPQQLPDEVLREHGCKTNDELASEMVDELMKKEKT